MKITIELEDGQISVLKEALDMYSRMLMGQWRMLTNHFDFISDVDYEDKELAREHLLKARDLIYPDLKDYDCYGIWHVNNPKESKIAYDIYQVIRNKIAWHIKPTGGITVDFGNPISTSGMELPKVEIKED